MAEKDDLAHALRKIKLARFEESEICPVIQALSLEEEQDDICLLELNSDIIECIDRGENIIIRGDADDPAVLCTQNKTFELKQAETSNSLLLVPDLLLLNPTELDSDLRVEHQNVSGILHTYLEMRRLKPNFKKLHALLKQTAYKGKEYEDSSFQTKHTVQSLLETIQSSEEELRQELVRMQACTIDGYLRVLHFDYKFQIFSSIVNVIESRSLSLNQIPKKSVLEELEDSEPTEVLDQCFSWYTQDTGSTNESGEKLYSLLEEEVCKLYAEVLLRSAGKFNLQDFLKSWQRSVPEGMTCSLEQLYGMALTDLSSKPEVIFYFPSDNLPENLRERFINLFRIKDKWHYDEIIPYLQDQANTPNELKAILLKHARETTRDGKQWYFPKW